MKKNITIQLLSLINFKGIKSLSIDFENQTNIFGANGTGKTTISDAFTWLLFGKDSTDRKDFEIKTLDANGKVIPQIEHEVSATLLVDNETLTLKRILRENWVKKRGSETAEFSGNVTDLYWNDVPVTVTEFTKKVNDVLNEQVFKMLTSPTYFNSIKWQDRRGLLIDVFGEVSNEEIAKGNPAFEKLLTFLTQGKTLEDYKAQINASIKKAKEDLKDIPSRIDEVFRGKPETQDFEALETEKETFEKQLQKIDLEISDVNKGFQSKLDEQRALKLKVNNLKSDIETIEANAKKQAEINLKPDTSVLDAFEKGKNTKAAELESFENALKTLESKKLGLENEISSIVQKMNSKRSEWNSENEKTLTFNDNDFHCPTCKREFESGDVESKKEEALKNFSISKQKRLSEINVEGSNLNTQKESLETELKTILERIETGKNSIDAAKTEISSLQKNIGAEKAKSFLITKEETSPDQIVKSILDKDNTYQEKLIELQANESLIVEIPNTDNSELSEKRKSIQTEIDSIKTKLQSKAQIEAADKRILELQDEEQKLSQQIADVEKTQFTIENFIKAKVDRLEETVNSKFKYVKFKMFDEQLNGGLRETCEATINGVPFSDVNTASKINAGLDIINVLSEFYGITAPIFIDNAESVHTLIDTESQLIRLVVSEQHKQLFVEVKELVA